MQLERHLDKCRKRSSTCTAIRPNKCIGKADARLGHSARGCFGVRRKNVAMLALQHVTAAAGLVADAECLVIGDDLHVRRRER